MVELRTIICLVLSLNSGLANAQAPNEDVLNALTKIAEIEQSENGWSNSEHGQYYAALEELNYSSLDASSDEIAAQWFGEGVFISAAGRSISSLESVNRRSTNSFSSGPILEIESAKLFELLVETRLSMPPGFLAGCLAVRALELRRLQAMGTKDAQIFLAIDAAAEAQKLMFGADGLRRAAMISNQDIDANALETQRLKGDIIGFAIFRGGLGAVVPNLYESEYIDPQSFRKFSSEEISRIITSVELEMNDDIEKSSAYFASLSAAESMNAHKARDYVCSM